MAAKEGRLAGKVAIVTGAGSGFGKAIAIRFAQEGANVLVGDINLDGATATTKEGPSTMKALHMDVTSAPAWKEAVETCLSEWKHLDIVVNNAGWSYKNRPTLEVTEEEWQRCFDINVKSVFHSIPAVVPTMKANGGGSIINISSIGSERPRPGLVWYNATKAAVSNASKALAAEYGPDNVRVNAICPLLSGTGLFEAFVGVPFTEENVQKFVGQVPLGRLTDPVDIANMALFLASDEGAFITGQNISVDGGKTI
ncbi:hypothetical protein FH972_026498 [Carpinus fangiana]|uniref:Uncharacterized protein n=1 Tax=Carpinus fangiana TaxID=176857 RepID=A0A5N6L455_9ROSI|nr:hypothetical protein FH972_026498 [Carpinus fangiana]